MRKSVRVAALASFLTALAAGFARAEKPKAAFIIFKDGFTLEGFVIREEKTYYDDVSHMDIKLPEGFFMVDDVPRRIIFSPSQVQKINDDPAFEPAPGSESFRSLQSMDFTFAKPLPPLRDILDLGPWDDKWNREFTFQYLTNEDRLKKVIVKQHLQALTPNYAWLDAVPRFVNGALNQYKWSSYYVTRELGPEQVRTLLVMHPDLKESREMKAEDRADRRVKIAQFLMRCRWFGPAEQEAERLERDFPDQKEKADVIRGAVKKLRAAQLAEDIRAAFKSGRFQWAQKHLAGFSEDGVPEDVLSDIRTLRGQYDAAAAKLDLARRFLKDLPGEVGNPDQRRLFTEAATVILPDLHPDNVGRLETFLGQAQQWERQRKAQRDPDQSPAGLLSMAVSGWVLGNTAAEAKVETAQRLWQTRQFVRDYLKTGAKAADREKLLQSYQNRRGEAIGLDEMAVLIGLLPPPDAEEKPETGTRDMKTADGLKYLLQLPGEYSHGRSYPTLIVLNHDGEKTRDTLDHWSDLAEKNGYILAAPEWVTGLRAPDDFTFREHAAVLGTLQDLRRRFQVDSDRVFLAGFGRGGDLAYEVGLSHPDLFAGVVPISAFPNPYSFHYRHNGQYLPFYVVSGDRSGDTKETKDIFREWVPHGYPVLYVRYKGRGLEWFPEELPSIFDWMDRKKRSNPTSELGRLGGPLGDEFLTVRPTDNHFYWLSTDKIRDSQVNTKAGWDPHIIGATLQANRGGNHINVRVQGLEEVTVWFALGDGMTDFDKPLNIYVGTQLRYSSKVTPSLETMLEDLVDRGDRQRLVVACVKVTKP
jgi:predicted esterase